MPDLSVFLPLRQVGDGLVLESGTAAGAAFASGLSSAVLLDASF
ncbi:MAG: hypothetical protein AAF682_06380 [Planctomycetota bacterium]